MENNKVKEFLNDMFGEVRTINKDGELWFVARDIATILDYRDTNDMIGKLDEDEKGTESLRVRSNDGITQNRDMTIINESELYNKDIL